LIETGLLNLEGFFSNIQKNILYCGPSEPRGPWLEETWIYII
jgi:hypothetical protein